MLEGRIADKIEEKGLSLQHYLKRNGYKNYFVLAGNHAGFGYLDIKYGKHLDFYFEGPFSSSFPPEEDEVLLEGLTMLKKEGIKQPYFLWQHFMGVHYAGLRNKKFRIHLPDNYNLFTEVDSANALRYVNNYKNGILETDAMLRTLYLNLRKDGFLENTLIVITADHAESLGEHGLLGHGKTLTPEQLHIPFIMIGPGINSPLDTSLFSQVDFAPRIVEELGLEVPSYWRQGGPEKTIHVISALNNETGFIRTDSLGGRVLHVLNSAGADQKIYPFKELN
jgi:arylsulfatase A-like enzyme